MTRLIVLRHGPTEWNSDGRIQGHSDIPLSEAGRKIVGDWHLEPGFAAFVCVTSPLVRARETARIMGLKPARTVVELTEMNWGDWEGRRLPDLRAERGAAMSENERQGLDFRPPGGESPRDIQGRLGGWLRGLSEPTVAVSHKGVIRALYALASGWDMTDDPPQKLRDGMAHAFVIDGDGNPTVERLNISLESHDK